MAVNGNANSTTINVYLENCVVYLDIGGNQSPIYAVKPQNLSYRFNSTENKLYFLGDDDALIWVGNWQQVLDKAGNALGATADLTLEALSEMCDCCSPPNSFAQRTSVASLKTFFETSGQYDVQGSTNFGYFNNLLTGGATAAWQAEGGFVLLSENTGRAISQTKCYWPFFPGKRHVVMLTGRLGTSTSGESSISRIGLFDEYTDKDVTADRYGNGFFFTYIANLGLFVVRRYSTALNVQTDVLVSQANWNIDPLNGTGPSNFTIDPLGFNTFVIEFTSTTVKYGIMVNNEIIFCHGIDIGNGTTSPFSLVQQFNLPVRFEANSGSARVVKSHIAYMIEGSYSDMGRIVSAARTAGINPAAGETAILAIRVTPFAGAGAINRIIARPLSVSVASLVGSGSAQNGFVFKVYFNGTITTAAAWTAITGSNLQILETFTAYTPGRPIATLSVGSMNRATDTYTFQENTFIGCSIDGLTSDFIVVTVLTGPNPSTCGVRFLEYY